MREELDESSRLATVFEPRRAEAIAWLGAQTAVTPTAAAALADWLVFRLAACAQTALDDERRRIGVAPEALADRLPADWLTRYPVVARLLTRSERGWRDTVTAYLNAIARDHERLGARPELVAVHVRAGRLAARRPTLISTLGESRWVYRAHDRAMAGWFQELCAALNPKLSLALHVRTIVCGDGYSWDQFVPGSPCTTETERRRFFVRAGMLVRLAERLAAIDLHCENVLAAGEYPVLIDIETLFAPYEPDASAAREALEHSPLRSGLVQPAWFDELGRPAVSWAGFQRGGRLVMPRSVVRLAALDSPEGGLVDVYPVETIAPTIPARLADHVDELLAGYDEMARVELPEELLARTPELPRRALGAGGVQHDEALHRSLAVELVRDEAARDAYLAGLPLSELERAAIRDLELPRAATRVGAHPATHRLPALSPNELARRHDLIRTTIALDDDRVPAARPHPRVAASYTAHAVAIGDFLLAVRFAGGDWHGALWVPWAGSRTIDELGPELLSGRAGVALAFAYLACATGLARFRDAALAALEIVPGGDALVFLGGYVGLGGAVYALARCGELLGEQRLVDEARRQLLLLPARRLEAAPHDLVLGTAGLALAAFAVGELRRDIVEAVERGGARSDLLPGGSPSWVPDVATSRAIALARAGRAVDHAIPLPWQVDSERAATALVHIGDVLDDVDLALAAAHSAPGDPRFAAALRDRADRAVAEHARTGRWFPSTSIAERHQLSVLTGLPAMLLALLAADAPDAVRSVRRLE